jgi:hypothetical protein
MIDNTGVESMLAVLLTGLLHDIGSLLSGLIR